MAKRGRHSFLKRLKENKRREEAAGKMARRQGKVAKTADDERVPPVAEHVIIASENVIAAGNERR